ncbi:F-box/LRR-repeat protein [Apostasia shenzhenica]|uniref:F-box/LRR-repeat protein n=1 Tax=Apostasia shenzhenica TaxID=1088818 RepID=A0A2I0B2E7_9ASPA|nr:F-box/LRR-repeat protein [Apostasia shenzhenica]
MEDGERNWEDMEIDCLVNIFCKVGLDDLAVSLPLVCRSWSAAAGDALCWKALDFRDLDFMPWSSFSKAFTARFFVPRFSFSGFLKLAVRRSSGGAAELRLPQIASMEDLVLASNECPRLKILSLPKLTLDDEARIPDLIAKWKDLQRLEIESKPSNFFELAAEIAGNCRVFSDLAMPCSSIKKEDASAIATSLNKLRSLDLSRSYLPRAELLVILGECRGLERLSVKSCLGFEADEEVKGKAAAIRIFEHEGTKMEGDSGYCTDECDDLEVHVI